MTVLSFVNLAAVVLGLSALFGYVNHRWLGLPHTIGLVVMALFASVGAIVLDAVMPSLGFKSAIAGRLAEIDFYEVLMQGMLSFLLFAGALHVDLSDLANRKWAIGLMATFGVILSTALVGATTYYLLGALGLAVPFIWCLVFGALISPTDPVAVLGILKVVPVPDTLKAKIAGESLFNDGVGVVVFTILVAIAMSGQGSGAGEEIGALDVAKLFVMEALGGAVLGFALGWVAFRLLKSIDEHNLEVLITLALVFVTTSIALALHTSAPIAVVVAGLLIGNHGTQFAMSETTREHVHKFWSLLDEILNSVLFLIIGFEVIALAFDADWIIAALALIPVVLAARTVSVALPLSFLKGLGRELTKGAVPVLVWGGLRGGISVALVLSLPPIAEKDLLLTITYAIVIFSIVVQGLTVAQVVKRTVPVEDGATSSGGH